MPNQLPDLGRRNLLINLMKDVALRVAEQAQQLDDEANQEMDAVQAALDAVTAKVECIQAEQRQEQAALWEVVRQLESLRDQLDACQIITPTRRQRRDELLQRITRVGVAFVSALGGALLGAMVQEDVYPKLKWSLEWWLSQSGRQDAGLGDYRDTPVPMPVPAAQSADTPAPMDATPVSTPTPRDEPEGSAPAPMRCVVAPNDGDFTSIQEAISAMPEGSVVLIAPGTYQEELFITDDIHLIGNGQRTEIVIESRHSPVITFRARSGTVQNLTLRIVGVEATDCCVRITTGALILQDCDLSATGGCVIVVSGDATPIVHNNLIHGSHQSGVFVRNTGAGEFVGNEIYNNGLNGLAVSDSGHPTVRNNSIHNSQQSGVHVYGTGRGEFADNNIYNNGLDGVAVSESGNPTVRNNRIHHSKQAGVHVSEAGAGRFTENDIFSNGVVGVAVLGNSNPIMRNNRIHDSRKSGVYVDDNGTGTLRGNDIFGNGGDGITVLGNGAPTVQDNRVNGNKGSGVFVAYMAKGVYTGNNLRRNRSSALQISWLSAARHYRNLK